MNLEINEIPFSNVVVDISGSCNDKCKWCSTGIYNEMNKDKECEDRFMSADEFKKGLEYLLRNRIVAEDASFSLYNWGEPLLNPEINDILHIMKDKNLRFALSTNASKCVYLDKDVLDNLNYLFITLSGFSKETYNRVQSLDFEHVKNNIVKMAKYMRENNAAEKLSVYFLVYQFNFFEIEKVKAFCNENGINLVTAYGFVADYDVCNEYLDNINGESARVLSQDIFSNYIDDIRRYRPNDYVCPQSDNLVFDHNFNIIPCCRLNSKSVLGNLYSCDIKKIKELKNSTKECEKCQQFGQDFLVHNIPNANEIVNSHSDSMAYVFFYDTGNGFNGEQIKTKNVINSSMLNTIELEFDEPVKAIRFDPIEGSACIINKFLIDCDGVQAYYFPVTGAICDGKIILTGDDPQLIINFGGAEVKKVKISVSVSRMS